MAGSPTTSASSSTTGEALDRIVDYGRRASGWQHSVDGYDVVIVDDGAHLQALGKGPGSRIVHRDDEIAIVARRSN